MGDKIPRGSNNFELSDNNLRFVMTDADDKVDKSILKHNLSVIGFQF